MANEISFSGYLIERDRDVGEMRYLIVSKCGTGLVQGASCATGRWGPRTPVPARNFRHDGGLGKSKNTE